MRDAASAAYYRDMAEIAAAAADAGTPQRPGFAAAAIYVELEPEQPPAVSSAVGALLADDRPGEATAWWRAGIADALAGGTGSPSAAVQGVVGAAPLRNSRGTDRP